MVCLATYMREVTLNFNGEDITIWAPNERSATGVVEMMTERRGEPGGIFMISEIAHAADMVHQVPFGPIKQQLRDLDEEMERLYFDQAPPGCMNDNQCILDPEHAAALDEWRSEGVPMEKSLFTEWNQSTGKAEFIGGSNGHPHQFTPEMLEQRDNLNRCFNHLWNNPHFTSIPENYPQELEDPWDQRIEVEILHIGDNYAVGKCEFGGVYIPRGAVKHLKNIDCCEVGGQIVADLSFSGKKHPWWVTNIASIV